MDFLCDTFLNNHYFFIFNPSSKQVYLRFNSLIIDTSFNHEPVHD